MFGQVSCQRLAAFSEPNYKVFVMSVNCFHKISSCSNTKKTSTQYKHRQASCPMCSNNQGLFNIRGFGRTRNKNSKPLILKVYFLIGVMHIVHHLVRIQNND